MNKQSQYWEADVTIPEAAALLGVSAYTMRRILDKGLIPYTRPLSQRRVKRADVRAYRQSVTEAGVPELATLSEDLLAR